MQNLHKTNYHLYSHGTVIFLPRPSRPTVFNILNNYDRNEMNCFILLLFRYKFFSWQFSEVHPSNVLCAKY